MHLLREQAIVLRKQGKSYTEIQAVINVSKGTLSYWLKNITLLPNEQKRLFKKMNTAGTRALIKRNKQQTVLAAQRALQTRISARKQMHQLTKQDLFLVGVALYWGEGYKRGAEGSAWKCVDFTNSDPDMIVIMLKFFQECCAVPKSKIRMHLMLHDQSQKKNAIRFWSRTTNIPTKQFVYTSFTISKASQRKRQHLKYGTVHIRIHDTNLFFRIIGWIDGLRRHHYKTFSVFTSDQA